MLLFENYLPEIKNCKAFDTYLEFIEINRCYKKEEGYYYEEHHIVPRCYLPENLHKEKENLVLLRGKNHLKAHILLEKALKDASSCYTVWQMLHRRNEQGSIEDITPEEYEYYRKRHAENAARILSKTMKGRPSNNKGKHLSESHKKHISEAQKGKILSIEHRKNLSEAHKGYIMPQSQRDKISQSNKGKIKDETWRDNLRKANLGNSNGIKGGIHIYREEASGNIIRTIIHPEDLEKYIAEGWIKGRKGVKQKFTEGCVGVNLGKIWVTNNVENRVIDKSELKEYEQNGWHKGKTFHKNR